MTFPSKLLDCLFFLSQNSQSQSNEQITNYLKPQGKESKENHDINSSSSTSNNNNNIDEKSIDDNNKNQPSENTSKTIEQLLDDDFDDDFAMIELDF